MIIPPMQRAFHPLGISSMYVGTDATGKIYSLADVHHDRKERAVRERPCQSEKAWQMQMWALR
jgi:hypothetical protein